MSAVAIRVEVLEHYCLEVCQSPQGQCFAVCPLRKVAEINRRMDEGAPLKQAAKRVIEDSDKELRDMQRKHDLRIHL